MAEPRQDGKVAVRAEHPGGPRFPQPDPYVLGVRSAFPLRLRAARRRTGPGVRRDTATSAKERSGGVGQRSLARETRTHRVVRAPTRSRAVPRRRGSREHQFPDRGGEEDKVVLYGDILSIPLLESQALFDRHLPAESALHSHGSISAGVDAGADATRARLGVGNGSGGVLGAKQRERRGVTGSAGHCVWGAGCEMQAKRRCSYYGNWQFVVDTAVFD
mmetsp:Transcript_25755/g.64938  ORF Transcript_25755/g.64938 Transcript_25755/m.64938 type:complete len:218 (+) Transcript_25755:496-1149(+)